MIRVLVVDDHPVVRSGLVGVLSSLEGFEVVAVAADGHEAVREAVLHRPDVALMDLRMPGADGFTAIRELARASPDVRVCVLTMYDDDDSLFAAMRAGAHGYLLKGAEQEEIARAVRAIAAGEVIFGPCIAVRVLRQLNAPPNSGGAPAAAFPESHRTGAGGPRSAGRRDVNRGDRTPARPDQQDGQQPRVEHPRQAPGGRPHPGRDEGAPGRPGPDRGRAARQEVTLS
jgi:DNA-binding NarL/FixJ family response regulator